MGWTSTHVNKGQAGQYMADLFNCENEHGKWEMLKGAFVGWGEHYSAVRITPKATGISYTIAVATLIKWTRDYHNFTYKDMDESMGPYMYNCPESILKLLTPSTELVKQGHSIKSSASWRVACWEKVFERKMVSKLADGAVIKFPQKILFGTGEAVDTFVMRKHGKQKRFYLYDAVANKAINAYSWYRLRKRDLGNFSVIGKVVVNA